MTGRLPQTQSCICAHPNVQAGDRYRDVWMGVDCFGRGTLGGGGLHCDVGIEAANAAGLSVALFAIGWPYEHAGGGPDQAAGWPALDELFWRKILSAGGDTRRCSCAALPLWTNFCSGRGRQLVVSGSRVGPGGWWNMSLQQLQPGLLQQGRPGALPLAVSYDFDNVFDGGNSLRVTGPLAAPVTLSLFYLASTPLPEGQVVAALTVASAAEAAAHVALVLQLSSQREGEVQRVYCWAGREALARGVEALGPAEAGAVHLEPTAVEVVEGRGGFGDGSSQAWETRSYVISRGGHARLNSAALMLVPAGVQGGTPTGCDVCIGEMACLLARAA
jgi:hypothetical protein